MNKHNISMVGIFLLLFLPLGCGGALQKTKSTVSDVTSLVSSQDVDEKLYAQVPEEKKSAVAELEAGQELAQKRLDLARAVVEQKEAELRLAKSQVEVAEAEKEEAIIQVDLAKMRAVQSAKLGDPKKVNTQVAKLEAKHFEQKASLVKIRANAENDGLTVEEQKKKVKELEQAIK